MVFLPKEHNLNLIRTHPSGAFFKTACNFKSLKIMKVQRVIEEFPRLIGASCMQRDSKLDPFAINGTNGTTGKF
jgi:hypothetical protein